MRARTVHVQGEEPSLPWIIYAKAAQSLNKGTALGAAWWRCRTETGALPRLPAWRGVMHCWLTPALRAVAELPENQAMAMGKAEDLQNPAFLSWCSLPRKHRKKASTWKGFFFKYMHDLRLAESICRLSRVMCSMSARDEFSLIKMLFT